MADAFTIEGQCKKCGGTVFTVPDDAPDSAWITCDGCGERFMTWGTYKAEAFAIAVKKGRDIFGKGKRF